MIVSDKALPIRFYNNLFDQNRFNHLCHNNCQLELVYPASKLPHFQFRRDSIFASPSKMFLRNVCNDLPNFYNEVPEGANSFCNNLLSESFYSETFPKQVILETTIPPANYQADLYTVDCCKFKLVSDQIPNNPTVSYVPFGGNFLSIPISSNTARYHFRICVDKLVGTSTIVVKNGGNTLGIISQAGCYDFYFTSIANNILLEFATISYGDYFEISSVQATILNFDTILSGDVDLNPADINIVNMKDATDILVYCNDNSFTSNIPDGEYYYVIKSGADYYFSEVFKIVSLKTLENYFKLEWYNDCDINSNILYNAALYGCQFKNVLYLDAALFNPEYNTEEESEVNGEGDLQVRYKRWQKSINLDAGKTPPFLTDALSAIFMHDTINITQPLNKYQQIQSNVSQVIQVTSEISDILNECFQRVILKLLLEDKLTDTACCGIADIIDCTPCDYEPSDFGGCVPNGYYFEIIDGNAAWWVNSPSCTVPRYKYILRRCNDGSTVNPRPNSIICFMGQYYRLYWFTGFSCVNPLLPISFWAANLIAPVLQTAIFTFSGFIITGQLLPNTYGQAYFQPNCVGPWIAADVFPVDANGNFTYVYPISMIVPYAPITSICFKVANITQNCNFGETNVKCVGTCPP